MNKPVGTVLIDNAFVAPILEFDESDTGFILVTTERKRDKWNDPEPFMSQRPVTMRITINGVTNETCARLTRFINNRLEFCGPAFD